MTLNDLIAALNESIANDVPFSFGAINGVTNRASKQQIKDTVENHIHVPTVFTSRDEICAKLVSKGIVKVHLSKRMAMNHAGMGLQLLAEVGVLEREERARTPRQSNTMYGDNRFAKYGKQFTLHSAVYYKRNEQ